MKPYSRAGGFSLVEITIALAISAFCLVAIFGLLPVALNGNQSAISQTASSDILSSIISDLRATPPSPATETQQYHIPIPKDPAAAKNTPIDPIYFSENGSFSRTAGAETRYRVTIKYLANSNSPTSSPPDLNGATLALVTVSWPAAIDPAKARPAGSAEAFVALNRN